MPTPHIEEMVNERRRALWGRQGPLADGPLWGLALSGGGIRSATFCFGLLKALARDGSLLCFDLLSTVSGGGYIGATIGKLFHQAQSADEVRKTHQAIEQIDTRWLAWWLRANGRYLIPGGLLDKLFTATLFLRNLVAVHLELAVVVLMLGALLALYNLCAWPLLTALPPPEPAQGLDGALRGWLHAHQASLLRWLPSTWLLLPLPLAVAALLACAYWSLREPGQELSPRWLDVTIVVLAYGLAAGLLWWWRPGQNPLLVPTWPEDLLWAWLLLFGGVLAWVAGSLLAWGLLWHYAGRDAAKNAAWTACQLQAGTAGTADEARQRQLQRAQVRNRLTVWLSWAGLAMLALLLLGVVDRLAWYIAFEEAQGWWGAALAALAALLRLLLPRLIAGSATQRPLVGLRLAGIGHWAGVLVLLLLAVWWVSVADTLVFLTRQEGAAGLARPQLRAWLLLGVGAAYLLLSWANIGFLNRSSLHDFYRARLVRSYLGAANGSRFERPKSKERSNTRLKPLRQVPDEPAGGLKVHPVHDVHAADDVPMPQYAPHRFGGPVHLVNVCINETHSPRGGLFNRDRRGLPLTIGPQAWMRVNLRPWRQVEDGDGAMTLGTWMSISGAAVAPGAGSGTSMGMAALNTVAGLRLGYWWDSHVLTLHTPQNPQPRPDRRPRTMMLLDELLGRFNAREGTYWYLSDGGHFENTGAYALLAEEAALVVVADCGADPRYGFKDLENLVRKARIDLQADIEFLRPNRQAKPDLGSCFGSLDDLAATDNVACIALARISYRRSEHTGLLVLIKPNVCNGLPVDLINFKREYPDFPQERTSDQFFSEAQWESYFQLGQTLGEHLGNGLLQQLPRWVAAKHFVPDDCAHLDSKPAQPSAKPDPSAAPPATGRLPRRITGQTLVATVSLGALIAAGPPLWQAWDSLRSSRAQAAQAKRDALKDLAALYGRLSTQDNTALAALAASLLHMAETLCPNGEADWFQRSPMAQCALEHVRALCARPSSATMPACNTLVPSVGTRPLQCLEPQPLRGTRMPYWGQNFDPVPPPCPPLLPSDNPVGTPAVLRCRGKTIYIHSPGPERLGEAAQWREAWSGGHYAATVPAVEDVNASAARTGRATPRPYPVTTVLWHDKASRACAESLFDTSDEQFQVRTLPPSQQATSGVIEVWLARRKTLPAR